VKNEEIIACPRCGENIGEPCRSDRPRSIRSRAGVRADVIKTSHAERVAAVKKLVAKVVAHEDSIFIELLTVKHKLVVPTGFKFGKPDHPGTFGTVILDSTRIGMSDESIALMKKIRRGRDAIGDIEWFETAKGPNAFSWFGALHRVIHVPTSEGARGFRTFDGEYVRIANVVTDEMKKADPKKGMWRTPYAI
jgi:hypothetical protein